MLKLIAVSCSLFLVMVPHSGSSPRSPEKDEPGEPPDSVSRLETGEAEPFEVSFEMSKKQVARGGSVTFTLKATNRSESPLTLTFPSGQEFDFLVKRDGQEVWRWSWGQAFTQAIRQKTWRPRQEEVYRDEWALADRDGNPAPPGTYEAVGILATTPPRTTRALVLSITAD